MARREDKNKALSLRKKGYSYSQIKEELGISKSTLSGWLSGYPLSPERIKELRGRNPRRIERFRNTMRKKREEKERQAYEKARKDIGRLSRRELFLGGLFLYWGEGWKTGDTTVALSNTDPVMIGFFIKWLYLLGVENEDITVALHLYSDMNVEEETDFWLKSLKLPKTCLRKPKIKQSKLSGLTYKNGFGHGTCHLHVYSRDLERYIKMSLQFLKDVYNEEIKRP